MPKPAESRAAPLVEHRHYRPQPEGHEHGYHQLLFGLAGASELELDGHVYRVDDRTGLVVPAGSHHDYMGHDGNLQLVADFPARSVALPARLMARPRAFALDGAFGSARWRRGVPRPRRGDRSATGNSRPPLPRRWRTASAYPPTATCSRCRP